MKKYIYLFGALVASVQGYSQDFLGYLYQAFDANDAPWDSVINWQFKDNVYQLESRQISEYDANGRRLRLSMAYFEEATLSFSSGGQYQYQYDGLNRPISESYSYYSGGNLVPYRITYTDYFENTNNKLTVLEKNKVGLNMELENRTRFHYNSAKKCDHYVFDDYNSVTKEWEPSDSISITYNSEGFPTKFTEYSYSGGWELSAVVQMTFNNAGKITHIYALDNNGGVLDTTGRYTFTYEGNNRRASEVIVELYDKPNSKYMNYVRFEVSHYDELRPSETKQLMWAPGTEEWIPFTKSVYYYKNRASVTSVNAILHPMVNPCNSKFEYKNDAFQNSVHTLELFDLQGRMITSVQSDETGRIQNTDFIPNGIYVAVIKDSKNQPVLRQKLLIQN